MKSAVCGIGHPDEQSDQRIEIEHRDGRVPRRECGISDADNNDAMAQQSTLEDSIMPPGLLFVLFGAMACMVLKGPNKPRGAFGSGYTAPD